MWDRPVIYHFFPFISDNNAPQLDASKDLIHAIVGEPVLVNINVTDDGEDVDLEMPNITNTELQATNTTIYIFKWTPTDMAPVNLV